MMRFRLAIPADHPIHLVLGLIIWSIWFVAIYGGLSVYCSVTADDSLGVDYRSQGIFHPLNIGLLIFTAVTCAILGLLAVWCWRNTTAFPGKVSAWLYSASLLATLAVAAPAVFLPPCL